MSDFTIKYHIFNKQKTVAIDVSLVTRYENKYAPLNDIVIEGMAYDHGLNASSEDSDIYNAVIQEIQGTLKIAENMPQMLNEAHQNGVI